MRALVTLTPSSLRHLAQATGPGLSNARISVPYCQIKDTLELARRLADCSTTRNSLPPILCFGNCDVSGPSENSSGIRSLAARQSRDCSPRDLAALALKA